MNRSSIEALVVEALRSANCLNLLGASRYTPSGFIHMRGRYNCDEIEPPQLDDLTLESFDRFRTAYQAYQTEVMKRRKEKEDQVQAMLEEMGAKVVADELNDVTWDLLNPEKPFESMAKRIMGIPYCLDAPARIAHIRKMAEEYQIQGAINPCHWGCRQGTGIRGLITRGLKDIGIPVLNLEIDCVDSRNLAPGQVRTRLEAFMEMLGQ